MCIRADTEKYTQKTPDFAAFDGGTLSIKFAYLMLIRV